MKLGRLAGALLLCLATPAVAQEKAPLILLLDGLGVYVENDYVGVSALARPLREQGYRTISDTHFLSRQGGAVPDVIVGHSMGGTTALTFARELVRKGYREPLVITIDAAPGSPSCPVSRCVNIHGPGFPNVQGASNIDAWASGARFVNHARLPTHPAIQAIILDQTASYISRWRSAQVQRPPDGAVSAARPKGG